MSCRATAPKWSIPTNGGTVNYATADSEGLVEFYWEAATGQIFQMLDPAGDLVKSIEGFADNYVLDNFSGSLTIDQVVDLGDELLDLNNGLAARPTTADLASPDPGKGSALIMHKRGEDGTYARTLRQWEVIGGERSIMHWTPPDIDEELLERTYDQDVAGYLNTAIEQLRDLVVPAARFPLAGSIVCIDNTILRGISNEESEFVLLDGVDGHCIINEYHRAIVGGPTSSDTNYNIHLFDLLLNGNRDNQSIGQYQGVDFTWTEHFSVNRCRAIDTAGHGFNFAACQHGVVRQSLAKNFGDDGFSASPSFTDYSRPTAHITFEDCVAEDSNNVPIGSGGYNTYGSGFEADDGAQHIHYLRCRAYRCLLGFYADYTPSTGDPGTGNLFYNECYSEDAIIGHFNFVGHRSKVLEGLSLTSCRVSGRPTSPNSVTGALSITNGWWKNVRIEDFEAIDAGRINLRGIDGGTINLKYSDASNRFDIGGQSLSGGVETYFKDVACPRIEIGEASFILFERMKNPTFGTVTVNGAATHVQLTNYDSPTFVRLDIVNSTSTSQSLLIGGQSGTQECVGLEVLSGKIEDGAGHGIVVSPSTSDNGVIGTSINIDVRRVQKAALRVTTGSGGLVKDFDSYGDIVDACLNTPGSTNQVDIGSDSSSRIEQLRLHGNIDRTSGGGSNATRGVAVIAGAAGIQDISYQGGDISNGGGTSPYFDSERKIAFFGTKGGNNTAMRWNTAEPTSGTFARGDIIFNSTPSAAGTPGWRCTTAGVAGSTAVFKAMANLAA